MTDAQATPRTNRPLVEADERSQEFFDGAARGALVIQRCDDCGLWQNLDTRFCANCMSENLTWTDASGNAHVHMFGVMHQLYHPGFKDEIPYNIAVVELDEGPRIQTNIVGVPNEQIKVGMKVKAVFEQISDTTFVPKFAPA